MLAKCILPIAEADGPVTTLDQLDDEFGVETIVRALDKGVKLYQAGDTLFASWSDIALTQDLRRLAPEGGPMVSE
jgi:hypothetical protein